MIQNDERGKRIMLRLETYTCVKCGKRFTKAVGGIVASQGEMILAVHPVCDKCKLTAVKKLFK